MGKFVVVIDFTPLNGDDLKKEIFEFYNLQDAVAKYDYVMKNIDRENCQCFHVEILHNFVDKFGIPVVISLLEFRCLVNDIDVLL